MAFSLGRILGIWIVAVCVVVVVVVGLVVSEALFVYKATIEVMLFVGGVGMRLEVYDVVLSTPPI